MKLNRLRKTVIVPAAALVVGILAGASLAFAATSHTTTGTGGTHSGTTHPNNLAHVWLSLGADHAGTVTSGGRYHDNCDASACYGGFSGSDWAMDIGGAGTTASKMYIDYAG